MTSTRKRGAPVHLSGNSQPTLTSLPSPEHMTGEEDSSVDEEYVISSNPVDNPPSTTEAVEDERQSVTPELVSDISNSAQPLPDQTFLDVDTEHKPEQESETESNSDTNSPVPTALRRSARSTKAYLQYAMDRFKYTVPLYQSWKNPLGIDRFYMFPAIS